MFFKLAEAVIGLEREHCEVPENEGEMEVCVVIFEPDLDCPIVFPFEMIFYTTPGTAGIVTLRCWVISTCILYFVSMQLHQNLKLTSVLAEKL